MKTQNNQLIWQPTAYNARGQVTNYLQGTNLQTQKLYNPYGFQTFVATTAGSNTYNSNDYDFDEIKGNLLSRTDNVIHKTEYFRYDNLTRILADSLSPANYRNTVYSANGNITHRSDIGDYAYGDAGPHAVTGLSNTTGSLLPANNQTIDYTAFNKVSHISQGNLDYFITYGPNRQRSKTVLQSGVGDDVLLTKYYAFGDYEKEITPTGTRHLHYISGGDGLAAIYVKYNNAPDSLYFIMTDHLGSIVGAINSSTGTVYRQNFDAWGRKRNPQTWSYTNIPDFPFDRGYTGHEHLKWFGLINMNGRMYDVAICRFLSPDPFVQHPGFSQSYNRYTYCLNNPLKYTDPSGYNNHPIWIDITICWEAYGLVGGFGAGSSGLGPGSGNHWSDQYRSVYGNFMLMNTSTFNSIYGDGAWDIANLALNDPNARSQWQQGHQSLAEGMWVSVPNTNIVGSYEWKGLNSSQNQLPSYDNIIRFVKFDNPQSIGSEPLPLWTGWANNGVNALGYGAGEVGGTYRLMKSGSLSLGWYKSGWSTGNQYVKSTYSLSKLGTGVGLGTSFLGVLMGGYNFAVSDKSWGDYGQLGVSITSSVLTCFPATTPLGIGIGVIDLTGGFNGFYQGLDANQQLYNTAGGVILPINGIPTYIQLKK